MIFSLLQLYLLCSKPRQIIYLRTKLRTQKMSNIDCKVGQVCFLRSFGLWKDQQVCFYLLAKKGRANIFLQNLIKRRPHVRTLVFPNNACFWQVFETFHQGLLCRAKISRQEIPWFNVFLLCIGSSHEFLQQAGCICDATWVLLQAAFL